MLSSSGEPLHALYPFPNNDREFSILPASTPRCAVFLRACRIARTCIAAYRKTRSNFFEDVVESLNTSRRNGICNVTKSINSSGRRLLKRGRKVFSSAIKLPEPDPSRYFFGGGGASFICSGFCSSSIFSCLGVNLGNSIVRLNRASGIRTCASTFDHFIKPA
jgi:hypothetical protein